MNARIVLTFMGPQGSGKGTQAQLYARRNGFAVVSTGDLLRKEAQKDTDRGRRIAAEMTSGELISDEETIAVLRAHLELLPDSQSIILDGFPRTLKQAELLESIVPITAAVYISLPMEEAIRRISGRLQCPNGHTYNKDSAPPRSEGVCDFDGLSLRQREDDNEEAVKKRLLLHEATAADLLGHYRDRKKLVSLRGDASIDEVARELTEALKPYVGR